MKRFIIISLLLLVWSLHAQLSDMGPFMMATQKHSTATPPVSPTNGLIMYFSSFADAGAYPTNWNNPVISISKLTSEIGTWTFTNTFSATHAASNGPCGVMPYSFTGITMSNTTSLSTATNVPWLFIWEGKTTTAVTENENLFGSLNVGTNGFGWTTNRDFYTVFNGIYTTNNQLFGTNLDGPFHRIAVYYNGDLNGVTVYLDEQLLGTYGIPSVTCDWTFFGEENGGRIFQGITHAWGFSTNVSYTSTNITNMTVWLATNDYHFDKTNAGISDLLLTGAGTTTTDLVAGYVGTFVGGTNLSWVAGPGIGVGNATTNGMFGVHSVKNAGNFIVVSYAGTSNLAALPCTCMAWVKYTVGPTAFTPTIAWANGTGWQGSGAAMGYVGNESSSFNNRQFTQAQGAGNDIAGPNASLNNTNWHCVAYTFDSINHTLPDWHDSIWQGNGSGEGSGSWWTNTFIGTNKFCLLGDDANTTDCDQQFVGPYIVYSGFPATMKDIFWWQQLPAVYAFTGSKLTNF